MRASLIYFFTLISASGCSIERNMKEMNSKMDVMVQHLGQMGGQMTSMDSQLKGTNEKLDHTQTAIEGMSDTLNSLGEPIAQMAKNTAELKTGMDGMSAQMIGMSAQMGELVEPMKRMEKNTGDLKKGMDDMSANVSNLLGEVQGTNETLLKTNVMLGKTHAETRKLGGMMGDLLPPIRNMEKNTADLHQGVEKMSGKLDTTNQGLSKVKTRLDDVGSSLGRVRDIAIEAKDLATNGLSAPARKEFIEGVITAEDFHEKSVRAAEFLKGFEFQLVGDVESSKRKQLLMEAVEEFFASTHEILEEVLDDYDMNELNPGSSEDKLRNLFAVARDLDAVGLKPASQGPRSMYDILVDSLTTWNVTEKYQEYVLRPDNKKYSLLLLNARVDILAGEVLENLVPRVKASKLRTVSDWTESKDSLDGLVGWFDFKADTNLLETSTIEAYVKTLDRAIKTCFDIRAAWETPQLYTRMIRIYNELEYIDDRYIDGDERRAEAIRNLKGRIEAFKNTTSY